MTPNRRTEAHRPWRLSALLVLVSLMAATLPASAAQWRGIESVPGASPVTVLVNEQSRIYFRVTSKRPLVLPITGPTRLRVITRLELPAATDQSVSYRLRFSAGSDVLKEYATETSMGSQARLASGATVLGKSRRTTVDIPRGREQLTIAVADSCAVLVRVEQAVPGKHGVPMVSLTPVSAPRSVTVVEGEKSIAYYSALPGKAVHLRVVGPITLDLLSRLDFDATMHGTQSYRFAIRDGDQVIRTVDLKTTKAATASYSDLKDWVPSKSNRTRIQLAEGLHEIALELVAPPQGAAEFHARIPQSALRNQE